MCKLKHGFTFKLISSAAYLNKLDLRAKSVPAHLHTNYRIIRSGYEKRIYIYIAKSAKM